MDGVIGVILGGGQGRRLFPLTKFRSKPAVPIGGKYRLIDIPISNCLHSGVDKIFVLTQFNSASLHRHIAITYRFDTFSDAFVEILAAEQTMDDTNWYQGTADAVRRQLRQILSRRRRQCLILSGDHLYRMDYRAFVEEHRASGADVSLAVKPVRREQAPGLGILKVGDDGRVLDFREKPTTQADLDEFQQAAPSGSDPRELFLASMGVYVFEPEVLASLLLGGDSHDFGSHIIPDAIHKLKVHAFSFDGYWADIGTIQSFYQANLGLTDKNPRYEFYRPDWPIYTHQRHLAGSRIQGCRIEKGLIAEGCRIGDAEIERCVIGVRTIVEPGARLYNSIVMGADYYESSDDRERNENLGQPHIGLGAGTVVHRAIIDKNARIGANVIIANDAGLERGEGEGYFISDGIVVIPKDAIIPDGTRI